MDRRIFVRLLLVALCVFYLLWTSPSSAQEVTDRGGGERKSVSGRDIIELETVESARIDSIPLPSNLETRTIVVGSDGPAVAAAPVNSRLAYSNTLGESAFRAFSNPAGILADDLTLLAPDGCRLRAFSFSLVAPLVPGAGGGPFRVEYGLYETCPNAPTNPAAIEGTEGFVEFNAGPNQTRLNIFVIIPESVEVPLKSTVWLGLRSAVPNVGVIGGAPAMIGYSTDRFDVRSFPCNAYAGGFPDNPHASYNAEVYVDSSCPKTYPAYQNLRPSFGILSNMGGRRCYADDVHLNVDSCLMVGLVLTARVTSGLGSSVQVRVHRDVDGLPGPMAAPPRTATLQGVGTHTLRFSYSPGILLDQGKYWVSFQSTSNNAGWVLANKDADIGREIYDEPLLPQGAFGTRHTYARSAAGEQCALTDDWELAEPPRFLNSPVYGGFDVTIHCLGEPPVGACCDMYLTDENNEAVCRDVAKMNCPFPGPALSRRPTWVEGESCASDPFPHPCGLAACCKPDDFCENLTENECHAVPPVENMRQWQIGRFCGEESQWCLFNACVQRTGICEYSHGGLGCRFPSCCQAICERDPWCCTVAWDRTCLRLLADPPAACFWAPAALDSCGPTDPRPHRDFRPFLIEPGSPFVFTNATATVAATDPAFACHTGFEHRCSGGPAEGQLCETNDECPGALCLMDVPPTGFVGQGSVWFRFVAEHSTARISLCHSDEPNADGMVQVFRIGDPSSGYSACQTLIPIGCSDDSDSCPHNPKNPDLCVKGLIKGEEYYVMFASKTIEDMGIFELRLTSPCEGEEARSRENFRRANK